MYFILCEAKIEYVFGWSANSLYLLWLPTIVQISLFSNSVNYKFTVLWNKWKLVSLPFFHSSYKFHDLQIKFILGEEKK